MLWVTNAVLSIVCVTASCSQDSKPSRSTSPMASEKDALAPTPPAQSPQATFETKNGPIAISLEVVSTPAKIQRGLMHRRHLPPERGMLFVFSSERVRSFWMKNTLIPLDMLFVRADFTIAGIESNTTPLSLESRSVNIATQYVIEVNGGWAKDHSIEAGAQVTLEHLPAINNAPL